MPRTPLKFLPDHGAVDNSIFELPDLPHPLALAAHARNVADAEAAAMAAAAMPDQYDPGDGGGVLDGYARLTEAVPVARDAGAVPNNHLGYHHHNHHHPPNIHPLPHNMNIPPRNPQQMPHQHAAAPDPVPPQQMGIPMSEVMIPQKWLSRYEDVKRYKRTHGNFNVSNNKEHKQLLSWVRTQKQQYKMLQEGKPNHMSQARINLLNEIDFEWTGEKRDKFWHDRYNELVDFHARYDTTRIPEKYTTAPQLHTWVSLQRRQLKMYREGKITKLTDERIRLLEAVGLECNIRNNSTWMDRFMELKRYKDEHGDCNVPQKWKQNPSLGRWVDNQKTQHKKLYDGKPTHLTIERIQLLVSLGFNWRRG